MAGLSGIYFCSGFISYFTIHWGERKSLLESIKIRERLFSLPESELRLEPSHLEEDKAVGSRHSRAPPSKEGACPVAQQEVEGAGGSGNVQPFATTAPQRKKIPVLIQKVWFVSFFHILSKYYFTH